MFNSLLNYAQNNCAVYLFGIAKKARICEYMKYIKSYLEISTKSADESLHKHYRFDQILVHFLTMQ